VEGGERLRAAKKFCLLKKQKKGEVMGRRTICDGERNKAATGGQPRLYRIKNMTYSLYPPGRQGRKLNTEKVLSFIVRTGNV